MIMDEDKPPWHYHEVHAMADCKIVLLHETH